MDNFQRRIFLGVDGGGTKTHIVLMNENRLVLGEGFSGPSNPLRVGVETAVSNIAFAVNETCEKNRLSINDIAGATLGLAGVRRDDIRKSVRDRITKTFHLPEVHVTTDAEIAWYGTTNGAPGLVIIAGTGSVCLGKDAVGKTSIAGGWGPLAGDEGGGAGISRLALQAVAKAFDGRGQKTALTEQATEYFRVAGPEALIVAIYSPQVDNLRIAGFAKYVVETALAGDRVAVDIINDAGKELGIAASAVIRNLGLQNETIPVGCVGGIFKAGSLLTTSLKQMLRLAAPQAYLTEPSMSPATAAAIMAISLPT